MIENSLQRQDRAVRIETLEGAIEGCLRVLPQLRTLDELNQVTKRFVTLHAPECSGGALSVGNGPLSINKGSVLFVRELSAPPVDDATLRRRFTQAPLCLWVKQFEIRGFVHFPDGGIPIKRIDQDSHLFVSLTDALITGPDGGEWTAPFVAVNCDFITAAEEVELREPAPTTLVRSSPFESDH